MKPDRVGAEQARAAGVRSAAHHRRGRASLAAVERRSSCASWLAEHAETVLLVVSRERSAWQWRHVYAEAQRQLRAEEGCRPGCASSWRSTVTDRVLQSRYSVPIGADVDAGLAVPAGLRRRDGSSVFPGSAGRSTPRSTSCRPSGGCWTRPA